MSWKADDRMDRTPTAPSTTFLDPRLHRVLANPLRHEIVMRTGARPWSAPELSEATGYSSKHVSKSLEELRKEGLVEPVGSQPGPKGGSVRMYRACRFILDAAEWERLSDLEQASATGKIVFELHGDMAHALEAGTFYAHPHHAMIRDHRMVDDEGMERCAEILTRAYEELVEAEVESVERCKDSAREPFRIVIGLAAFPAAPDGRPE
jgi:DNA-binding transcriptional ArsR family regulator